jgi:hypothetical protein
MGKDRKSEYFNLWYKLGLFDIEDVVQIKRSFFSRIKSFLIVFYMTSTILKLKTNTMKVKKPEEN